MTAAGFVSVTHCHLPPLFCTFAWLINCTRKPPLMVAYYIVWNQTKALLWLLSAYSWFQRGAKVQYKWCDIWRTSYWVAISQSCIWLRQKFITPRSWFINLSMQTVEIQVIFPWGIFFQNNPYFIKESILSTYDFLTACSLELLFSIVFSIHSLFFCFLFSLVQWFRKSDSTLNLSPHAIPAFICWAKN